MAYLNREYTDESKGQSRYDLWIRHGKPEQVQRLAEGVSPIFLTVDSSGRLIYLPQAASDPQVLDVATGHTQALPLALTRWQYPQYPQAVFKLSTFQITGQPKGSQAMLFAYPWTLLFDTHTNQACAVDLGQTTPVNPIWALQARWGPDGRYLALVTIDTRPGQLVRSAELAILDMETGVLRTLQPAPDRHGVTSIAWAPSGRYLAVLGIVYMGADRMGERREEGVFIVDAVTGAVQPGPSGMT